MGLSLKVTNVILAISCFYSKKLINMQYQIVNNIQFQLANTCINAKLKSLPKSILLIPQWMKFRGVYKNQSVRLSVQILVWPITFICFDIGSPFMAHYKRMCGVHSWSWHDVDLWPQCQFYRVFDMLCLTRNLFALTPAYHIWLMGLLPWEDALHIFMIPTQHWPLTTRSN